MDLLEEAAHLLRLAPVGTLACYYVGGLPFALGFLYFWGDMSRSAFAAEHCALASIGLAGLYVWMKSWHAVFARRLRHQLQFETPPRWTWSDLSRLVAAQAAIQSTGLVLVPVAVVMALPLGWVIAFYHSVTAVGDGTHGVRETLQRCLRHAMLWPVQNHLVIGMVWFFWMFVWANVAMIIVVGPWFLQTFLGIKTLYMMSIFHTLNSTYLVVTLVVTHLCVNPLLKAVYLLRCFYGDARHTGDDLKSDLHRVISARALLTAGAVALAGLLAATPGARADAEATPPSTVPPPVSIAPSDLDQSIQHTLEQRAYTWRLPRERVNKVDEEKNLLDRTLDELVGYVVRAKTAVTDVVKKVYRWVRKLFEFNPAPGAPGVINGRVWATFMRALTLFLLVCLVAAVAYTVWRAWKRRTRAEEVMGDPVTAVPDVADENVTADQLPSEGWLLQARQLMEQGELRLALRALYLASLAMLAQRELILIAKFKSNRDYERELGRRARGQDALLGAFGSNVTLFESAWYGMHDVTGDVLGEFSANLERIQSHAQL